MHPKSRVLLLMREDLNHVQHFFLQVLWQFFQLSQEKGCCADLHINALRYL
jgi:ATP-dependent Clp protease adapter protein ClpS